MAIPLTSERPLRPRGFGALRVWEHELVAYRRLWVSNVLAAIIRPLFYMAGMGYGVGTLVDAEAGSSEVLGGLTYFQFFAPAVMATTAMMVLSNDALWPIRGGFEWNRTFYSQASSPITPGEIVAGMGLWHATKGLIVSAGVGLALVMFPSTRTTGVVLAVLFGALTGVVYAAALMVWSASRPTDLSFANIHRFLIAPMFLFSGAFYPIGQLPVWLQWVSRFTPIWHGVELCRGAAYGTLGLTDALVHISVLVAVAVVSWWLCVGVFARRLAS